MDVDVRRVVEWMESWAPTSLAEEGDKVGLQIGSMQQKVQRVAVALDVTEAVVDEAIERDASLIIAHHPILFRPLTAIRTDRADGRLIAKLVKRDVAVYASHTNLDVAVGGVNDLLADALGLQATKPLKTSFAEPLYKLVTFVPSSHADAVREAVFAAGAGHIGRYSHCGFTVDGTG
ncbi:MAG TPA: Nif3-like dinuclear metal center hexameric protein, partial [Paenibacillus sp.]|nr:Nif3-like dinuclear metal center hexameric protein [Paenibacillus sp.]